MLAALSLGPPAQAVPVTHADVYFRRTIENPFTDPGFSMQLDGVSQVSLSSSRPEGSSASVEGDAAAGTLKAYANAVPAFVQGQEAWARGFVNDHFTLSGPADGTALRITATYTVDGWLTGPGSNAGSLAAFANAAVTTQFIAGTGNLRHTQWARTEAQMSDCWTDGCSGFSVPIHWVDQIDLDVVASTHFDIYYALNAYGGWAYGGSLGTSDFGSTGTLSFTLPLGTRIGSAGGFSQSNLPTGIPEPSIALLLASGLISLRLARGGAMRRQDQHS